MKKFHKINLDGIGRTQYLELKYFCLAYPEKKKRINSILNGSTEAYEGEREKLGKDCDAVEIAVRLAVKGQPGLYAPLLNNLVLNDSIDKLPCGRNQAFAYRRQALVNLQKIK